MSGTLSPDELLAQLASFAGGHEHGVGDPSPPKAEEPPLQPPHPRPTGAELVVQKQQAPATVSAYEYTRAPAATATVPVSADAAPAMPPAAAEPRADSPPQRQRARRAEQSHASAPALQHTLPPPPQAVAPVPTHVYQPASYAATLPHASDAAASAQPHPAWPAPPRTTEPRRPSVQNGAFHSPSPSTSGWDPPRRASALLAAAPPPASLPVSLPLQVQVGVPKHSTRVRTRSASKPMQAERESADRSRAMALSELGSNSGAASPVLAAMGSSSHSLAPSHAHSSASSSSSSSTPSYLAPIRTVSKTTLASVTAQRAAQEAEEQRFRLMQQQGPPRARPVPASAARISLADLPQAKRPGITSYTELLPSNTVATATAAAAAAPSAPALPLTLSQCSQCLVQVLRVLQSPHADTSPGWAQLQSILREHPLSGSGGHHGDGDDDEADVGDIIASLQREQDLVGEALASNSARMLAQLPRATAAGAEGVDHSRMQKLFRWHQTMMAQKKNGAATGAPVHAASPAHAHAHAPTAVAAASPARSNAGASTPTRGPPAVVSVSLTSAAAASSSPAAAAMHHSPLQQQRRLSSRPSSAQSSPTHGAQSHASYGTPSDNPISGGLFRSGHGHSHSGSSSVTSAVSSNAYSVSEFLSATSRPLHPQAAMPIPVRKGRYEDLPSRLLDHFKPFTGAGAGAGLVPPPRLGRSRSSSRSHSRSQSRSHSRAGSGATTPRSIGGALPLQRSRSMERPLSRSSIGRASSIPNHALAHALRAESDGGEWEQDDDATSDASTELDVTVRRPRRSDSVPRPRARLGSLAPSLRAEVEPYRNKPSVIPPSLGVGEFSAVSNKMQIVAQVQEQQDRQEQTKAAVQASAALSAAAGAAADALPYSTPSPSPDSGEDPYAAYASPDPSFPLEDDPASVHSHTHSHAPTGAPSYDDDAHAHAHGNHDIVLPNNLNDMVSEIESMNASLEALLARELRQERAARQFLEERAQRRRMHAQQRPTPLPPPRSRSGSRSGSRSRSRSGSRSSSRSGPRARSVDAGARAEQYGEQDYASDYGGSTYSTESLRDASIRRPRAIFPGSAALYADDPLRAAEVAANGVRRSRSRVRRGVDPSAPPHQYTPLRSTVLPPNPHSYQAPVSHTSGVRAAGPSPVPQARHMSFLEWDTNRKHQQLSDSMRRTLDGLPSPASRRRNAPRSPPRVDDGMGARSSRSRSTTPRGSPLPLRKHELVPQARGMAYLSPQANQELLRQTQTYAPLLAGQPGGGGSAQRPIRYVRSRSVTPDRRHVDRREPQARAMGFLAPEVNAAHVAEARTWRAKLDNTYEPQRGLGVPPPFRYDPRTDPALRRSVPRAIVTQARGMGYLSGEVNQQHLRAAQLQEARVRHGGGSAQGSRVGSRERSRRGSETGSVASGMTERTAVRPLSAAPSSNATSHYSRHQHGEQKEFEHERENDLDYEHEQWHQHQQQHSYPPHSSRDEHSNHRSATPTRSIHERPSSAAHPQDALPPSTRSEESTPLSRTPLRSTYTLQRKQQEEQQRQQEQEEEELRQFQEAERLYREQQRHHQQQQQQQQRQQQSPAVQTIRAPPPPEQSHGARYSSDPLTRGSPPLHSSPDPDANADSPPPDTLSSAHAHVHASPHATPPRARASLSPSPRRGSEASAERHAAQEAAYESAEREWAEQLASRAPRSPGGAGATRVRSDPPEAYESAIIDDFLRTVEQSMRLDDEHLVEESEERDREEMGSSTLDADRYYTQLRAQQHPQQQQEQAQHDEYDPLAAESASHAYDGSTKRVPTLRPSKRQK